MRLATTVCGEAGPSDVEACDSFHVAAELIADEACAVALGDLEHARKALDARKRRCAELEARLCVELGEHARSCKTVHEATPKLSPERCTQMLAEYPEVLRKLKQRSLPYRVSDVQATKLVAGDPPALGPAGAKLQLVEFIDFESTYCVQAAAIVRELRAKYGSQLRVIVRQFPLPDNSYARLAAEAALAAHAQGKFWELHDRMLEHQAELDRAGLLRHAGAVGLDVATFRAALDSHAYRRLVDADLALVDELAITGMPTLFLNGERMINAVDRESIIAAIDELLAIGSDAPAN